MAFVYIDRAQEDKNVLEYQKTKDEALLTKIMQNRDETLGVWTTKCYREYMEITELDFKGELKIPLINAINTFKPNKKHFNTWLMFILQNHINNIIAHRFSKKRKHEGIFSLDEKFGEDEVSAKDNLPEETSHITIDIATQELVDDILVLMRGTNDKLKEDDLKQYLSDIAVGSTTKLACNGKGGSISSMIKRIIDNNLSLKSKLKATIISKQKL